jgi:hypothetical protein
VDRRWRGRRPARWLLGRGRRERIRGSFGWGWMDLILTGG